ncbi:hypothetical protein SDC9_112506 [bioreactor metagenome]|uniref:Uncharacterized protein n=1 Tax=bioreactor metagenome TaxID=1076179 RepID=A0A645BJG0_9ZZZZ
MRHRSRQHDFSSIPRLNDILKGDVSGGTIAMFWVVGCSFYLSSQREVQLRIVACQVDLARFAICKLEQNRIPFAATSGVWHHFHRIHAGFHCIGRDVDDVYGVHF